MGHEKAVFEGRTLEDAVKKGLAEIGRTRAEVMITILEEGSGGFLGLGARPYKVRIMPRPGGAFREVEREREPARGGRGGRGRSEGGRAEAGRGREGRERGPRPARAERGERAERPRREVAGEPAAGPARRDERRREGRPMRGAPPEREPGREMERGPERGVGREPGRELGREPEREMGRGPEREMGRERSREPAPFAAEAERAPSEGRRRRRGRRGGGSGAERPERQESRPMAPLREAPVSEETYREPEPVAPRAEREDHRGEARERPSEATAIMSDTPGMSSDELAATGKRLTEEFFAKLGFDATVTASAQEDHVDVAASVGNNEALLTGPKGEVRQALQHLLNRMLNRGEGSRYHLQLEINEFWKHREDELRSLAHRLADEALAGNTEAFTEYLNAQERRIVHVALKEDSRVKTYALGTGLIKRVAVAPADFPEGPRSE